MGTKCFPALLGLFKRDKIYLFKQLIVNQLRLNTTKSMDLALFVLARV